MSVVRLGLWYEQQITQHKSLKDRYLTTENFILSIVRQSLIFFVTLHQVQ
nr:MAG TPA: hypothetical protein [Caudoviricetes sp.]